MLGDIVFHNPTKLIFGEGSLKHLKEELKDYNNILLSYGKGSIKKNGVYDQIITILKEAGKNVVEDPGVMPNPTNIKVYEGCKRAKELKADLILAVGGGSCCDYAKTVSISTYCDGDFYEKYFINGEDVTCETIPVACILTMPGTGSEMNEGAVISNPNTKSKLGYMTGQYPVFSILDPTFTYSLPKYQMVSGIFDILSHIMENYFAGYDDNTTDYLAEGLMNSLIHSSKIAIKNPKDYEARSNIMWCATWGLNYMLNCGKFDGDWQVHCLGETLGGFTDATHGMTLSAISLPYYRYIMNEGIDKFARFATNVWHIDPTDKTQEELAKAGLNAMENWMKEIGVVMHTSELGLPEELIPEVAKKSPYVTGSYKPITEKEACEILRSSL